MDRFAHGMTVGTNALLDGARRPHRAARHRGLHGRDRDRPPDAARALPAVPAGPSPLVPAELRFAVRERITPDGRPHAARRGLAEHCGRAGARRRDVEVGRSQPAALLRRPEPRAARRRGARRAAPGRARLGVARGARRVPRVRADLDDRDRRLPGAAAAQLPRTAGRARATSAGLPEPEIMQSSGGCAAHGGRRPPCRLDRALGSRRRGGRRRPSRRARGCGGRACRSTWAAPPATWRWWTAARHGRRPSGRSADGCCSCRWSTCTRSAPVAAASAGSTRGGALRVGPQSAGARPGPACYGAGGELPTVTDANLLLGYLDTDSALPGGMRLDVDAAERARRPSWAGSSSSTPPRPRPASCGSRIRRCSAPCGS